MEWNYRCHMFIYIGISFLPIEILYENWCHLGISSTRTSNATNLLNILIFVTLSIYVALKLSKLFNTWFLCEAPSKYREYWRLVVYRFGFVLFDALSTEAKKLLLQYIDYDISFDVMTSNMHPILYGIILTILFLIFFMIF